MSKEVCHVIFLICRVIYLISVLKVKFTGVCFKWLLIFLSAYDYDFRYSYGTLFFSHFYARLIGIKCFIIPLVQVSFCIFVVLTLQSEWSGFFFFFLDGEVSCTMIPVVYL